MSLLVEQRGSATVEFAVVLPAVLAVIVLAIGSILLATQRLSLTAVAAEIARLEARGDRGAAEQRLSEADGGMEIRIVRERSGALHCVTLIGRPAPGTPIGIELSARGCAALVDSGA